MSARLLLTRRKVRRRVDHVDRLASDLRPEFKAIEAEFGENPGCRAGASVG